MSKPKDANLSRRIGWDPPTWQSDAEVRSLAQRHFLQAVSDLERAVLATLADVGPDDELALAEWATRWHLTAPWCLGYARGTLALWHRWPKGRGRVWGDDDTPRGRWIGWDPARGHLLKEPRHFAWLARYQVQGCRYATIAAEAGVAVQIVHEACARLADSLALPLRPTRRGRPPKS